MNRAAAVSSTASELDLSRKTRRRDLRGRLKLPPTVALASSVCGNEPPLIGHWGHRGASGGGPGGTGTFRQSPCGWSLVRFSETCDGTYRMQLFQIHVERMKTTSLVSNMLCTFPLVLALKARVFRILVEEILTWKETRFAVLFQDPIRAIRTVIPVAVPMVTTLAG